MSVYPFGRSFIFSSEPFHPLQACRAEDEKYSESKAKLKQEIGALRSKVLEMIAANEELHEMERLGRQEFNLDTDEYQRMLTEEEKLIKDVRGEIEFSNLAKMFLRQNIKQMCWDKMTVKGRTIKVRYSHSSTWY